MTAKPTRPPDTCPSPSPSSLLLQLQALQAAHAEPHAGAHGGVDESGFPVLALGAAGLVGIDGVLQGARERGGTSGAWLLLLTHCLSADGSGRQQGRSQLPLLGALPAHQRPRRCRAKLAAGPRRAPGCAPPPAPRPHCCCCCGGHAALSTLAMLACTRWLTAASAPVAASAAAAAAAQPGRQHTPAPP